MFQSIIAAEQHPAANIRWTYCWGGMVSVTPLRTILIDGNDLIKSFTVSFTVALISQHRNASGSARVTSPRQCASKPQLTVICFWIPRYTALGTQVKVVPLSTSHAPLPPLLSRTSMECPPTLDVCVIRDGWDSATCMLGEGGNGDVTNECEWVYTSVHLRWGSARRTRTENTLPPSTYLCLPPCKAYLPECR